MQQAGILGEGRTGSGSLWRVLLSPHGRMARREFQRWSLGYAAAAVGLVCLAVVFARLEWRPAAFASAGLLPLLLIPATIQMIRRLHDLDRTGWWIVLSDALWIAEYPASRLAGEAGAAGAAILSLVGLGLSLWLMVLMFGRRGTPGPNRFGPAPDGV
ncbi:DUF805 domain-containing protein [uncultured Methylobacterium sp.]|jgi:uncharacterized membrane protein YhaH (DUF805 family)|uniref:DUF805 domain-containing protein n=1 Tax=uncultured Methylobacterium sp. TaxID=157278 RepID=UPI002613605E|nr:DUF805 domain-containing protein [uncultured Methylobacterium sp.]